MLFVDDTNFPIIHIIVDNMIDDIQRCFALVNNNNRWSHLSNSGKNICQCKVQLQYFHIIVSYIWNITYKHSTCIFSSQFGSIIGYKHKSYWFVLKVEQNAHEFPNENLFNIMIHIWWPLQFYFLVHNSMIVKMILVP